MSEQSHTHSLGTEKKFKCYCICHNEDNTINSRTSAKPDFCFRCIGHHDAYIIREDYKKEIMREMWGSEIERHRLMEMSNKNDQNNQEYSNKNT